jgi:hypothetical protein
MMLPSRSRWQIWKATVSRWCQRACSESSASASVFAFATSRGIAHFYMEALGLPPGEPADGAMTFLAGDTVLIVEQATGSTARTQPPICTGRFDFFAPEWKACQCAGVAASGAVFFGIDSTQSARLALLTAYALFTIACAAFPTWMRCSPDDTLTSIAKI